LRAVTDKEIYLIDTAQSAKPIDREPVIRTSGETVTFDHARPGDLPPDALLREVALTVRVRHRPGEEPQHIAAPVIPTAQHDDPLGKWMGVALGVKSGSRTPVEHYNANRTERSAPQ